MQRIAIIGTSGSGKTTLARSLSERLALSHVELDALFWEPGWVKAPDAVFVPRVDDALSGDRWAVDGGYSRVRHIVWARADTLIWLDYPLLFTLQRLLRRTVRRVGTQEELWNGNRERLWTQLGPDSLIWYAIRHHQERRKSFVRDIAKPEHAHLVVYRFKSANETACWLSELPKTR